MNALTRLYCAVCGIGCLVAAYWFAPALLVAGLMAWVYRAHDREW